MGTSPCSLLCGLFSAKTVSHTFKLLESRGHGTSCWTRLQLHWAERAMWGRGVGGGAGLFAGRSLFAFSLIHLYWVWAAPVGSLVGEQRDREEDTIHLVWVLRRSAEVALALKGGPGRWAPATHLLPLSLQATGGGNFLCHKSLGCLASQVAGGV